ncbi:MAG: hypothetical protein GF398_07230 [Chitinivibrionales bacterium]|nr:hypothetical protein [Chitinivibrionales bacterium]
MQHDFGPIALKGKDKIKISSLCAVLAESEGIGLLKRNEAVEDIVYAVHLSAVKEIAGMYKRMSPSKQIQTHLVDAGALNIAMRKLIENELDTRVVLPNNPQIAVALGALIRMSWSPGVGLGTSLTASTSGEPYRV